MNLIGEPAWVKDAADKIKAKMAIVAARNKNKIPYTTVDGVFDDWSVKDINWWTNGFWGGMMWQLYNATELELYKEIAMDTEEKLDAVFFNPSGLDHDNGFRWLPTALADYRITGNDKSLKRGLLAAEIMAGRFNPAGNFIRAWNDSGDGRNAGIAIIDCMMNLPLLYKASEQTKDPRFFQIAVRHADTTMKYFIREDFSAIHIGEFDPLTGEFLQSTGGQGYGRGTSWTRGQSWALYGFTLSYIHTKKEKYLKCAENIAQYFISNIPESGLIPVDFRQPEDCTWEDSTAAAIASCGLIELSKYSSEVNKELFMNSALKLLKTLCDKRCVFSADKDNILEKCSAAYHEDKHEFSIIYGDYYLIEALWKLTGEEIFIW